MGGSPGPEYSILYIDKKRSLAWAEVIRNSVLANSPVGPSGGNAPENGDLSSVLHKCILSEQGQRVKDEFELAAMKDKYITFYQTGYHASEYFGSGGFFRYNP